MFRHAALGIVLLLLLSSGARAELGPFAASRHADHPLVGSVWSTSPDGELRTSDPGAVTARLAAAEVVLLGETHDNPDHHRLQARFVSSLAAQGTPATAVFEMLDPAQQPAVDAFRAAGGRDPDAFAERVGWADSGWPDFALYRPLFAAVLEAGLPIRAAGLARGASLAEDAPERDPRFGLDRPLPPAEQAARLEEMFVSHCELVPRDALGPMVAMQRARDARLARVLLEARSEGRRAILVAGNGHVREDGVPAVLARAGLARDSVVSVGLLEADPARPAVGDTQAAGFDFALVTPAAEREDPCESLRRRMAPTPGG